MQKVEIMIAGQRALVDADQYKKHIRKQQLVSRAMDLQEKVKQEDDALARSLLSRDLQDVMSSIIRLNRTIRQNVQFIRGE